MKIGRMPKWIVATGFVPATSALMGGCGTPSDGPEPDGNSTQVDSADANVDESKIQVKIVDEAGFEDVVASHVGNVVLMDAWATW